MLRKIRIATAIVFWLLITWLLVDFTGTAHAFLGWMSRIQLVPALLALNVGALIFLVALTLLMGRIYCSVICPLGVMQDVLSRFNWKKKYKFSRERVVLRYTVLIVCGLLVALGLASIASLVFPYSTYGRIASSMLQPLWKIGNNWLAGMAEAQSSYSMYSVDVWVRSGLTLGLTLAIWLTIGILAVRGGRTWCNTICPVGTLLGMLSRHARLKVVIDADKCKNCHKCEHKCKASCIDLKNHAVDYSRCVVCGDCLDQCKFGALSFTTKKPVGVAGLSYAPQEADNATQKPVDERRRAVITGTAMLAAVAVAKAQEKTVDGGLAIIEDKKKVKRNTYITPPGSISKRNMAEHCTACQLCVSACPNNVLRPNESLSRFMQPEVSYERGYCRPECHRCSDVCPTGAIRPITVEARKVTQVGHAVWVKENCLPYKEGTPCGLCARRCPVGAIQMEVTNKAYVQRNNRWYDPDNNEIDWRLVPRTPIINEEKCIGCGACENLCPSRPFSAIYVEGHEVHREL